MPKKKTEMIELNKTEIAAIKRLKSIAKIWPKTLWLFSGSSTLWVMRCNKEGEQVFTNNDGGADPDYAIESIKIPNDGGDW